MVFIDFWSIMLKNEFEDSMDFVDNAVGAMNKAKELGFNYLRFSQN